MAHPLEPATSIWRYHVHADGAHFGALSSCYCGFGCDRYRSLCFLRPNSQCAQKLFMGLGPS
jgi:hypothetical protein